MRFLFSIAPCSGAKFGLAVTLLLTGISTVTGQCVPGTQTACNPRYSRTPGTVTQTNQAPGAGNWSANGFPTSVSQSSNPGIAKDRLTNTLNCSNFALNIPTYKHICAATLSVSHTAINGGTLALNNYVTTQAVVSSPGGTFGAGAIWPEGVDTDVYNLGTPTVAALNAATVNLQAHLWTLVGLNSLITAQYNSVTIAVSTTDTTVISCLPAEMGWFKSSVIDGCTKLEWQTLSEINNDYFIVQKMIGDEFIAIGRVDSRQGTTQEESFYDWTDCNLLPMNYYRIIQIDVNGLNAVVTDVSSVPLNIEVVDDVALFPNPSESFTCAVSESLIESVQVFSPDGRVVHSEQLMESAKQTCISVEGFIKGVYLVQVATSKGMFSKQLIVN